MCHMFCIRVHPNSLSVVMIDSDIFTMSLWHPELHCQVRKLITVNETTPFILNNHPIISYEAWLDRPGFPAYVVYQHFVSTGSIILNARWMLIEKNGGCGRRKGFEGFCVSFLRSSGCNFFRFNVLRWLEV